MLARLFLSLWNIQDLQQLYDVAMNPIVKDLTTEIGSRMIIIKV